MSPHPRIPNNNRRVFARDLVAQRSAARAVKRAASKQAKAAKDKEQASRQEAEAAAHAEDQHAEKIFRRK